VSLDSPTAQISVGELPSIAKKMFSSVPGFATWTFFQARPFQCRTRFTGDSSPTAQAFFAPSAVMPSRTLLDAMCGRLARFHFVPFQCRIVAALAEAPSEVPVAQASFAEIAATSMSVSPESPVPKFGDGTRFHFVPFQCSVRVSKGKPDPLKPTA